MYEVCNASFLKKVLRISILVVAGILCNVFYLKYFNSPWEEILLNKRQSLIEQFNEYYSRLDSLQNVLSEYQEVDESLYRPILQKESIPMSIREAGMGGSKQPDNLLSFIGNTVISTVQTEINDLQNQIDIQKRSYNELADAVEENVKLYERLPAIQPISVNDHYYISSYFGKRHDPFTARTKNHHGIDFAAQVGTPIYATGKGTVSLVRYSNKGYGNEVIINHGFGYKTRYAHLHNINVKKGDVINRGELIATVGNTGRSTGPHLHYEVIHNRRAHNPINYYSDDLDSLEYEKMLKKSKNP